MLCASRLNSSRKKVARPLNEPPHHPQHDTNLYDIMKSHHEYSPIKDEINAAPYQDGEND